MLRTGERLPRCVRRGAAGKLTRAAAAYYRRTQTPAAGDAFAQLLVAAAAKETVEVWPENWPVWELFMSVRTQWTVGMGGRTGLRYEAVYPLLDRAAKDAREWDSLFHDMQWLEGAALTAMYEGASNG